MGDVTDYITYYKFLINNYYVTHDNTIVQVSSIIHTLCNIKCVLYCSLMVIMTLTIIIQKLFSISITSLYHNEIFVMKECFLSEGLLQLEKTLFYKEFSNYCRMLLQLQLHSSIWSQPFNYGTCRLRWHYST